jgi:hypothetical protein
MFYVIHNTANQEGGEHLSQQLRNLYGGENVADVRADDTSVPDSGDAGHYWTAAQVLMKLCDMYADNVITSDDTLIFTWFHDPNARLVNDLNISYNKQPSMYWYTFKGTGVWTISSQKFRTFEELA